MKFGEKVRQLRREAGLTQAQLAAQAGLGLRTVISYEKGESYPKKRSVYDDLAAIFGVDVNYLRTDDEEFLTVAAERYGAAGQRGARNALEQAKVCLLYTSFVTPSTFLNIPNYNAFHGVCNIPAGSANTFEMTENFIPCHDLRQVGTIFAQRTAKFYIHGVTFFFKLIDPDNHAP